MKLIKKYSINLFLIGAFASLIYFSGCDDTITNQQLDNVVIPNSNIDYYQYIQPIFDLKCANTACHDDQTRAAGLSLTSYAHATADPLVVFPYQPESSKLVWAIEGTSSTSLMPPLGAAPPLTKDQIRGIKTWIKEGAKVSAN